MASSRTRKICVVTGSRAEYGVLYWLLKEIDNDPDLRLQLLVTGSHLSPEYGLTYKIIENDGFNIDEKVEILLSSDTPTGITKTLGIALISLADALNRLRPDMVVLLGDRYEIMAAAQAAMLLGIPIAHISGGETTEGVVDDVIRHSITKMSHLHFVAAEPYRKRVVQLGENPAKVFNYGDPALDNIKKLYLLNRRELEEQVHFELGPLNFLVAYHPVTLEEEKEPDPVEELLAALDHYPQARIIITGSNADAGGRTINKIMADYAGARQGKTIFIISMGQICFLSAIKHCQVLVGNSSSGIVEAPALHTASVNIGDRQKGRLKAVSIIDCPVNKDAITRAIDYAISPQFQRQLVLVESLYGDCDASYRIKEEIKQAEMKGLLRKKFYDLDFSI